MSTDSIFVHKVWNENEMMRMNPEGVRFPMLSDAGGKIGQMYGIFDDQSAVDMRGTFIIDPDGVIQSYEVTNAPVGRNFDETLRKIQALQQVRESRGAEAMPAGWTLGKDTLTPSPELVGNVWKDWTPPPQSKGVGLNTIRQ